MTHWNGLSVMGDYAAYKSNLLAMVDGFWRDLQAPVLVGQLSNNGSDRAMNDAIRRAQQEVWREHPHARPGAVTYDIYPTDGCHFRDPARMNALAARWSAAVLAGIYQRREWTGPVLAGIRRTGTRRLTLDFDRPMTARSWDGRTGDSIAGFRFTEGGQTVEGMRTMRVTLDGGGATLDFTGDLPDGLRVHYGSGADGQDGITLRDAANGLPAPMLFDVPVPPAAAAGEQAPDGDKL